MDRKRAILETLTQAQEGDVVLIAGKGHEDYQIIGTQKYPFSDVKIVEEVLGGRS
ncbi:UDP-N-acetylmuramoyl-L-alanyl-D-glutamate--2,6-diaminopimelate ligase [compost metagenome]